MCCFLLILSPSLSRLFFDLILPVIPWSISSPFCIVEDLSRSPIVLAATRYKAERRRCESAFRFEDFTRSGFPFSRTSVEDSRRLLHHRPTFICNGETAGVLRQEVERGFFVVPGDDVRHGLLMMDMSTGVEATVSEARRSRTSQRRWQLWHFRRYELCKL